MMNFFDLGANDKKHVTRRQYNADANRVIYRCNDWYVAK